MQRYDFSIHSDYFESIDGGWIRYEDHVEAMKRIAGAPVAQGLTDEQIEAIWQTTPTDGIHYIYGEPAKELRIRFARAILAQAAPVPSAQQAEPQRNPLSEAAAAANCTYPHCTTAVGCQGTCKTYLAAPPQAAPVAQCQHDLRAEYEGENGACAAICANCGDHVQTAAPSPSAQQAECERCGLAPHEHVGTHWCDNQSFRLDGGGVLLGAPAPAPSAQQAEPVANNEAYDLAYDKIDRFLRSNLDDDDYAEFSRALDSLFAAPAPASPADQSDTERLSWLAEAKAELRLTVRDDYMLCIGSKAIRTGKTPRDAIDAAMSASKEGA